MHQVVAVTGATGFIGQNLLDALIRNGWLVNALTRKQPSKNSYKNINWVFGDLDDRDALLKLVTGASAIIHCAGAVRGNSPKTFFHANAIGTENLLQAVASVNLKPRFLLISSLAAREPLLSWYAASKSKAEQILLHYLHDAGISYAIFRPSAVYGPGDKELLPVFQASRYGIVPVISNFENRFGLLHVSDLVELICYWLSNVSFTNGIYEIDDATPGGYSYQSVAEIAQQILHRPVRCIKLPGKLIQLIARMNLWISKFLNYSPMLTPGKFRELQHPNWVCDMSAFKQKGINWVPHTSLREAFPYLIKSK